METKYYIYVVDTHDRLISAALSCSDAKTAKQAYQVAKREFEAEHGSHAAYHFGFDCVGVDSRVEIEFEIPPRGGYRNAWLTTEVFDRDDFESAEKRTEKTLSKGWIQDDILFIKYAQAAVTELFLGFDPRDVLSDKPEKKEPPWKKVSSDMKSADDSAITPSEPAIQTTPIIVSQSDSSIADYSHCPPMMQAASGVGIPTTAVEVAYNEPIEWADEPADTRTVEYSEKALAQQARLQAPVVEAINKLHDRLDKSLPFYPVNNPVTQKDRESAKTLNPPRSKIDYEKIIAGIYDSRPETKAYNSAQLLAYLKNWARDQGVEIDITASRIRQLESWKANRMHRESGSTRFGYDPDDFEAECDTAFDD